VAQYRLVAVACVLAAGVAGCAEPPSIPRAAAQLSIGGASHAARPPACTQLQSYRTFDIADRDGQVEAVVLLSAGRVIPQWVKIRNIDGFTGSFWQGGVGEAHVDVANSAYTISGSAYGINSRNLNKVITTDFKISAEC
jgi:hypothetical protein